MPSSGRTAASSSSKPGEAFARLLRSAFGYTQRRVCSERDLRAYLARRRVPKAWARAVLARCRARGLIDDAACARLWAEHWARRGYAWGAIRSRLVARQLPPQAIEAAARQVGGPSADVARAHALVRRAGARGAATPARVSRQLALRGFDADVIERVLGGPPIASLVDAES